jgi:hypothetical protein
LIDREIVLDTLQYLVVRDGQIFELPTVFMTRKYDVRFHPYSNFAGLARESRWHLGVRANAATQ